MARVALGLGIAALALCWIPIFGWLGVVLGLAAAALGLSATLRPLRRGAAVAGLILGLIALLLGLLVQVPVTIALVTDSPASARGRPLPDGHAGARLSAASTQGGSAWRPMTRSSSAPDRQA